MHCLSCASTHISAQRTYMPGRHGHACEGGSGGRPSCSTIVDDTGAERGSGNSVMYGPMEAGPAVPRQRAPRAMLGTMEPVCCAVAARPPRWRLEDPTTHTPHSTSGAGAANRERS